MVFGPMRGVAGGGGSGTGRAGGRTPSVVAGQDAILSSIGNATPTPFFCRSALRHDAVSINPLISLGHNDMERIMAIMDNQDASSPKALLSLAFSSSSTSSAVNSSVTS